MAKKNEKAAAAKAAPAAKAETKKNSKKAASAEDKAAKRAARLAKLKERPAGQRPNSKSFDVIPLENGGKVVNFAYNVRKYGVVITSVAMDAEGNVVSTSVQVLPGFCVKQKKGHGTLKAGIPGAGRGHDSDEDEDEGDEDEDEE